MALTTLTQTVFNAPYGLDGTQSRVWVRGKLVFGASPLTYVTGGMLPGLSVTTANVLDPAKYSDGEVALYAVLTQPSVGNITAVTSVSSGATTTIFTANTPLASQYVSFAGLATATALNGLTLKVVSVSAGVSFVVASSVPTQTKTADTGTAVTVIGPDDMEIHSVSGSGYTYRYNKSTGTIQVFQSAGFTPTGTNANPTITTGTNATVTAVIATNGGALTQAAGQTGLTGVIAGAFTGDAVAAAALVELAAAAVPAAVSGDIIHYTATWVRQ